MQLCPYGLLLLYKLTLQLILATVGYVKWSNRLNTRVSPIDATKGASTLNRECQSYARVAPRYTGRSGLTSMAPYRRITTFTTGTGIVVTTGSAILKRYTSLTMGGCTRLPTKLCTKAKESGKPVQKVKKDYGATLKRCALIHRQGILNVVNVVHLLQHSTRRKNTARGARLVLSLLGIAPNRVLFAAQTTRTKPTVRDRSRLAVTSVDGSCVAAMQLWPSKRTSPL